jgi:type IV secretion system protein TrbL
MSQQQNPESDSHPNDPMEIPPSQSAPSTDTAHRAFRAALFPVGLVSNGGSVSSLLSTSVKWGITSVEYWVTKIAWTGTAFLLQVGAELGDVIVTAIQNWLTAIFTFFLTKLLNFSIVPLLRLTNPVESGPANEAWAAVFEIAVALFPILIIFGILNMPLAEQNKASLWRQGFRVVTVVVLIALSKPFWGLAIDIHNASVDALAPEQFTVSFELDDSEFGFQEVAGTFALFVAYLVAFILMLLAVPLAILGLVLRDVIVVVVYISTPLLAVLWYPDWGLTKQFHEFANKLGRMGLYVLLSGPLLGIAFRAISVITEGGIMEAGGSSAVTYWTQLVSSLAIPFLIVAIVWKSISWAGKPIGIGKAYGMLSTTAFVLASAGTGAVAGGASGAIPGGQDSEGDAGGGRSSGGSSGGGGSGGDSGAGGGTAASGHTSASLGERMRTKAGSTVDKATEYAPDKITEPASQAKSGAAKALPSNRASANKQRKEYVTDSLAEGEVELGEAYEQGVLIDEPANPNETVPVEEDGIITYTTVRGREQTVNLPKRRQTFAKREKAANLSSAAGGTAASVTAGALKKTPSAAWQGTKATMRAGAYGMAEPKAVYAYSAAQRRRQSPANNGSTTTPDDGGGGDSPGDVDRGSSSSDDGTDSDRDDSRGGAPDNPRRPI